jgi:hypothetical protein
MATNLEFIKSVNVQTASSTVQITDCFTDKYDVYKIVMTDFSTDVSGDFGQIRFINSAGSTITSANYDYAYLQVASAYTFGETGATNQTYIRGIGGQDVRSVAANANAVFYVYNPTDTSSYTFMLGQSAFWNSGNSMQGYKQISVLKTTDDVTGIEFFLDTNNIDELRASVYGVK